MKLQLYYDEQGDFLELHFGDYAKGHFKDAEDGIAYRVDDKTGKITGIAIHDFKKKTNREIRLPERAQTQHA